MQKTAKITFVLLLAISIVSVSFAAIQYVHYVENTASIIAVYGIKLVQDIEPYDIEVASIGWGNLLPAASKSSIEVFGVKFRLKNADNMEIWASWNINPETPLPEGVTVTAWRWDSPTHSYQWFEGFDFSKDPPHILSGTIHPEGIEFRITVESGTIQQDFGFTININAHDTFEG